MKKILSTLLVLTMVGTVATFTGCKYEEGPNFTFKSKTKRIVNTWVYSKVINSDGSEQEISNYSDIEVDIQESGTINIVFQGNVIGTGSWAFSDDKKNLVITDDDGDVDEFEIIRLAADEFWWKEDDGIQYQTVPK